MSTEREEFLKQFENVKTNKELPDAQLIKKLALFLAKLVGYAQNETSRAFSESPLFRPVPETAHNPQFFQLISK